MDFQRHFPIAEQANLMSVGLIHCYRLHTYNMHRDYFVAHPSLLLCGNPVIDYFRFWTFTNHLTCEITKNM